jgi:hypothetical protein
MELKIIIFVIGIIVLILYNLLEAWGHYDFESFAYNAKIIIKGIRLKMKIKEFSKFENNFYRVDDINYKFVSKDTCLARTGNENIPLIMIIRPIPTFSYKIKIKNDNCLVSVRISFLYPIVIGLLSNELFKKIIDNQKIYFNDIFAPAFFILLFIFLIIFSIINLRKVAKNFIKILRMG